MRHLVLHGARASRTSANPQGMAKPTPSLASEFPTHRPYDTLVALTRSGTTTEVVRLLGTLRSRPGPRTVAITADPNTPVVELADHRVVLDFADEKSIVQTRFATTSLALWRAWLGEDLSGVIEQRAIGVDRPVSAAHARVRPVHLLGSGMSVGIANEAALKLREASQSWTESYPAMEFRHGPISIVGEPRRSGCSASPPRAAGGPRGDWCARGVQRS